LAVDDFDAAPAATPVQRATILNELGAVLIARGDYVEAERILRVARPLAIGAPAAHVTNNLAALAALRGDRAAADAMYRSALALAGGSPDLESDRRAIEKNLEDLKAQR
jgi:Flp pilus assembly protein TadD